TDEELYTKYIINYIAENMKTSEQPNETVERNWYQRAETFYYNQINGSTYYNDAVPHVLEQRGILEPSSSVLDIGAGSGRYAIPFAKRCRSVHALDVSSKMLEYLKKESDK